MWCRRAQPGLDTRRRPRRLHYRLVVRKRVPRLESGVERSELAPPTTGGPWRVWCCVVRFVRRDPIGSVLLVAGVAEVHQFPDRVILVGLGHLTTAIPRNLK